MPTIDNIYKKLIEETQEKINLFAINNNRHGQQTQIEVLNAVKMLYEAHKKASTKKTSTKKTVKTAKKD